MKTNLVRFSLASVFLLAVFACSTFFFPMTMQRIDVSRGKEVFQRHCARCHSVEGQGGGQMGPSMEKIAQIALTRVDGQSKEQYIWESIVFPDRFKASSGIMPGGFIQTLSDTQIRDTVAFLSELNATTKTNYRQILAMAKPTQDASVEGQKVLNLDSIKRGQALFTGKFRCSTCHLIGEGFQGSSLLGPMLSSVGLYSPEILRESIRNPSSTIHPGYSQVKGVLEDGTVVTGIVTKKTTETVTLLSSDSKGGMIVYQLDLDDLQENDEGERLIPQKVSMMPNWDSEAMSEEELDCLVDFLQVLRG